MKERDLAYVKHAGIISIGDVVKYRLDDPKLEANIHVFEESLRGTGEGRINAPAAGAEHQLQVLSDARSPAALQLLATRVRRSARPA